MALIVCAECGKEISDKAAACPYCGNPMQVLFEKAPSVQAQASNAEEEYNKYMLLARRAKEENNSENAAKYYDLALQQNPLSWEASFYQVYYTAMGCRIMDISNASLSVANSISSTLSLIRDQEDQSNYKVIISSLINDCASIATMMATAAINHCANNASADGVINERNNRVATVNAIHDNLVSSLEQNFKSMDDLLTRAAQNQMGYLSMCKSCFNQNYLDSRTTYLESIIKRTDSSYTKPELKTGGCYVATCVYGSYDCPQVWTLRRYRDNTLASTWHGRAFVHLYYTVSPTIVKLFGNTAWFKKLWRIKLDKMVSNLNDNGVENTPYQDRNW